MPKGYTLVVLTRTQPMGNTFDLVLVDYQLSIDWLTVEEMMSSLNPQIMIPNVSLVLLTIISNNFLVTFSALISG